MSYSKGISWIDDCRIPFANLADADYTLSATYTKDVELKQAEDWGTKKIGNVSKETGRFPANILVSDDMLNDGVISKSVKGRNDIGSSTYGGNSLLNSKTKMNNTDRGFDDKGSNSRYYDIDKWFEKLLDV